MHKIHKCYGQNTQTLYPQNTEMICSKYTNMHEIPAWHYVFVEHSMSFISVYFEHSVCTFEHNGSAFLSTFVYFEHNLFVFEYV